MIFHQLFLQSADIFSKSIFEKFFQEHYQFQTAWTQIRPDVMFSNCLHSAILSTFIKLPFVIKIFALFIYEWPLKTERLPALHYSVDIIFLSFGNMGFIVELWNY